MTITLPKQPDGNQFEDFVAASLRALGYFIETRVILRDEKKEVLELDVVATPLGGTSADRELYEAKKSAVTFPSLFKLYGQRLYLGIERACLATYSESDPGYKVVYDAKGRELGVRPCCHRVDFSQLDLLAPPRNSLTEEQRHAVVISAWYLQIAKRLAQAALTAICNANRGVLLYEQVRKYAFEVHASFFAKTPLDRAEALYAAYFDHPKLTGSLVSSVAQAEGLEEVKVWKQVNNTDQRLWLQSQMLAEGAARIAILKNALDHVVLTKGAPLPTFTLKIGSKAYQVEVHNLPPRFVGGLRILHEHPHSLRLPYLFQSFLELCGGFLLLGSQEETEFLEALTGVPKKDILPAIQLLDEFFAPAGATMFYKQKDELLCLKMVPGFVRAIGSFLRYKVFGIDDYDKKYPNLGWLFRKWHLAGYKVLSLELPQVQEGTI